MLKYNDIGEEVIFLQRALNELLKQDLKPDGHFGKLTEEALRTFQKKNRLKIDGTYNDECFNLINPLINKKYLRSKDIEDSAKKFAYPVSMIKAFRDVEAKGQGFLSDGRTIILFERHKFYKYILDKFGQVKADELKRRAPNICNDERGGYLGYAAEYKRLEKAIGFDEESALKSASFGLFQIMGFNFKAAGYTSVKQFVDAMAESEKNHLAAVLNFIRNDRKLSTAIKTKNYQETARLYNGASYATNRYDQKLRDADLKYMKA